MRAQEAVEAQVRDSYGRLLAFLAARTRDLAAAEDALADALESALRTWPFDGVPERPEAWLLTAARRRLIDAVRHAQVRETARPMLELDAMLDQAQDLSETEIEMFPDERLKLMFVCAHPAIDAGARTPLMLQTVLGLDAATIAAAFLAAPSAMGQRLVRAKTKIRDAGIGFELPRPQDLPERLDAVLEAIYAAYGTGWEAGGDEDSKHAGLAVEAIQLARLLAQLMPGEPEALGLLSLMLHCEARRDARRDARLGYVPLSEQNPARWSREMIEEAESLLRRSGAMKRIGRFQLEAAIQSVHAQRAQTGSTRWEVIAGLYAALVEIAPTMGARVGQAAAEAEAFGAQAGLRRLDELSGPGAQCYQPWWAVRAHLLAGLGRGAEAVAAYQRAAGMSEDADVRAFLLRRANALGEV